MVRPPPPIEPPFQFIVVVTLRIAEPFKVPPFRLIVPTLVSALTITVPLLTVAVSPVPGGPLEGVQFPGTDQSPLLPFQV
jgi:hypothetical protein